MWFCSKSLFVNCSRLTFACFQILGKTDSCNDFLKIIVNGVVIDFFYTLSLVLDEYCPDLVILKVLDDLLLFQLMFLLRG